jgi:hypothetical protein
MRHQQQFSINICAGNGGNLIGPHMLPIRMNVNQYLLFLQQELPVLLEDILLYLRQGMWIQLDGATPHCLGDVRHFLSEVNPQRWIGRRGPVSWPPQSPDLILIDLYLRGNVKPMLYATDVNCAREYKKPVNRSGTQLVFTNAYISQ